MNLKQKLYDLKNQRKELIDAAEALALEGKIEDEDFKAKMAEVEKLNGQIEAVEKLVLEAEKGGVPEDPVAKGMKKIGAGGAGDPEDKVDAVKAFADAARAGFPVSKDLKEGVNEDGGYTVPEDIVTRVIEYRNAKASLRNLVSVENVTTNKGRRTFKKRSQQSGFAKVAEGGKITKKDSPKFEVKEYEVSKYAGFLPVTSELLEDSDENITNVIVSWIGDEARVTDNKLILEAINKKAAVAIDGLDGILEAVLVKLDSAFRSTTKIVTNSNGVYYLSKLKDENGRYLLNPIPSEPGKMQLACGPVVVRVEEYPNADLPNVDATAENPGTKVPFIIGDLKEGIKLFDRKTLTLTASDVAVAGDFNAYEQDMTLTRAIERLDVQQWDDEAYINGYIDTAAVTAPAG